MKAFVIHALQGESYKTNDYIMWCGHAIPTLQHIAVHWLQTTFCKKKHVNTHLSRCLKNVKYHTQLFRSLMQVCLLQHYFTLFCFAVMRIAVYEKCIVEPKSNLAWKHTFRKQGETTATRVVAFMGVRRGGISSLDYEIWHFLLYFRKKGSLFSSSGTTEFHHLWLSLEKSFCLLPK